jgi:hypothetical protein
LQGGVEPGWEGRVNSWNSRWGGGGTTTGTTPTGPGHAPRPAWTDSKETDQADDEEELTTDDEKDKVTLVIRIHLIFGSGFGICNRIHFISLYSGNTKLLQHFLAT